MADKKEESEFFGTYAAWASGANRPDISFALGAAQTRAGQAAADLYELHAMAEHANGYCERVRRVKDWGYRVAAEFVRSRQRRYAIGGYRLDWARQAARDGLCEALWGHVRGTGLAVRAAQFGVGERPYQRVRDHVRDEARASMNVFEGWGTEFLGAANAIDWACHD